jgi:hypothetical protein
LGVDFLLLVGRNVGHGQLHDVGSVVARNTTSWW